MPFALAPPLGLARSAECSALRVEDGNGEMELRSLAHFAIDPDAAAVNFDKMFGDGEPQPGAADFAGTSHINAVEALEDARLVRLWDSDAGIRNRKGYFGAVRGSADHDLAAGWSVLHGIVQQILQNFGETAAVRGDVRQRLLQIHGDTQVFLGGGALRGFDAALDELGNAQAANLQFQSVAIHFRKHEQIVGEPCQPLRVLENDLEEADSILRIVEGAGEQRFRKTLNRGERRSEFVGNVGNEITAYALELAQLGDVMQHDDRAGGLRGANRCDGGGEKMLAQRAGDDFGFDAGLTFQDAANRLDQLGLAHHFKERAPGLWRHVQAQDFREASIGEEQALGSIHDGHAFHHASENGGGKISFFGQRSNGAVEPRGGLIQGSCQSFQAITSAIRINRTKIAFRHAAGKHLQSFHATGERLRDQQRSDSGDEKHHDRSKPPAPAKFRELLVHRLERERKAQDQRWPSGYGQAHRVIQKISIDGYAVTNGLAV